MTKEADAFFEEYFDKAPPLDMELLGEPSSLVQSVIVMNSDESTGSSISESCAFTVAEQRERYSRTQHWLHPLFWGSQHCNVTTFRWLVLIPWQTFRNLDYEGTD
ncbi:MAG: hypothetical protein MHM6MM_007221, partial [Cercozoa sp. M6MM]